MVNTIFIIVVLFVTVKLLVSGVEAAWGIAKIICTVLFFPAFVIGLFMVGLIYIAIPVLIVGAIGALIA